MDLMNLLKNKKKIIEYLLTSISSADKTSKGLRSMKSKGFSNEGMIEKLIEVTAIQSEQIKELTNISLVYIVGDNFDADAVKILNMLGKGDEAIKQLWKNKMGL